jgi:hypothetical protein
MYLILVALIIVAELTASVSQGKVLHDSSNQTKTPALLIYFRERSGVIEQQRDLKRITHQVDQ